MRPLRQVWPYKKSISLLPKSHRSQEQPRALKPWKKIWSTLEAVLVKQFIYRLEADLVKSSSFGSNLGEVLASLVV